ncbi:MAG: hypothetical protein GFH24_608416n2 [Chloroflexi bacterium AL-N5]|nr:hypothetical protein [Chloroflexi bacterium AL-N5]
MSAQSYLVVFGNPAPAPKGCLYPALLPLSAFVIVVIMVFQASIGTAVNATFFLMLSCILAYSWWLTRIYFIGLRNDLHLLMRSPVMGVVRVATVPLEHIAYICRAGTGKKDLVHFLDSQGKRLAVFNPYRIPDRRLLAIIVYCTHHNPQIKVVDDCKELRSTSYYQAQSSE